MRDADPKILAASKLLRDAGENRRARIALRESQERLAHEVAGARTLQAISTRLISKVTQESLFEHLLDAAMELMGADASSIQMLAPDGKTLILLGWRNFHPISAAFWRHVTTTGDCSCGRALRDQQRAVISDIDEAIEDAVHLAEYRRSHIRAVQSTPLFSRAGKPLGMLSTHWRIPHVPTDSDFRLFDVLARQAADLIERTRTEETLRKAKEQQAYLLQLTDALRPLADPIQIQEAACQILGRHLAVDWAQYGEIDTERWTFSLSRDFFRRDQPSHAGLPSHIGEYDLALYPVHTKAWREGRSLAIADMENDTSLSEGERTGFLTYAVRAALTTPLMKNGKPVVVMSALSATPRAWTETDIALLEETADRTWSAIERARAEVALRLSETKYRSLFESLDDAFYLLEVVREADDRPVDVIYLAENAAGSQLAGRPVKGMRLSEVNAAAIPEWLPVFDRVARTGESERFERVSIVTGKWQHYHVFPGGSGKDRVGILCKDISSKKLAEEKLRESEEKFRAIANTSPVIIWMSDASNKCVFVNQPWLDFTGQSLEDTLSEEGWSRPIHPDDVSTCTSIFLQALERLDKFQMYFRLRRADGEYRWIVSSGAPRFHEDGAFAGYVGSSVDVTERRQAEDALATISQRLADAQEDERARIARELHDDVVQRLVGLGWRLRAARSSASAAEGAQEIENVRAEMMMLSKDVQALSHRLHPPWLEILGIAAAVTALCQEVSRQSGVEIGCQADEVADGLSREKAVCLYRVLQEALQNAIKHSRAPRVEVSLRAVDDEIEMMARDFGVGFNLAAPGHQGLGFTSMKERLKAVGGRLLIQSKQDGTTIQAYVPIAPTEPTKSA